MGDGEELTERDRFGRYLLRELRWELNEAHMALPELTETPLEQVEVLAFRGYDFVCFRAASAVFEARLSWRGDVAPQVERVAGEST